MAGECIEKIACTKSCGSSDGMQVYLEDGRYSAYCFVCGHYDRDPYKDGQPASKPTGGYKKSMSDFEKLQQVCMYPQADLSDRGIIPAVAGYYQVKMDPSNQRHYYPYFKGQDFKGFKERVKATKEFFAVGDQKNVDLFGQTQAASAQNFKLVIVEGEMDCLAAFQMLWEYQQKKSEYKDQLPSVVSLAHGASSVRKDLVDQEDFLSRFKEIVLAFDQDKAGQEALEEAIDLLPMEKVRVARFSEKDANAMLLKGKAKEFCQEILFKAQPYKPVTVKGVKEAFEQAIEMPTYGSSLPWPTLNKLTQGVKPGDMIGVAAGVGIGKSSVWHKFMSHHIFVNHEKVGVCFLEEDAGDTLKNLATHEARKRFMNAEGGFTQEDLTSAVAKMDGWVFLYEHNYQTLRDIEPWDSVKQAIRHMVLVEGCKHIVVDPLTALVAQMTSSEANDALNRIMAEMEALSKILGFTFYYGAHLNPPKTGASHEEGGRVFLSQLTGSRAMIKWSHTILGLERNTQAETKDERNTTTVRLLKGRKLGNLDKFLVYYDDKTGSFDEVSGPETYTPPPTGAGNTPQTPGLTVPNIGGYKQ
jgi:hypothetical protein